MVDRQCRESEGKAKIEGYMSVSDEEAHHRLNHKQASILMQLQTGHIALNKHLFCIHHAATPICPNCDENAEETIHHFLFNCTRYNRDHSILYNKLLCLSHDLPYLLSYPNATAPLLRFINSTGLLKSTFGNITADTHQSLVKYMQPGFNTKCRNP